MRPIKLAFLCSAASLLLFACTGNNKSNSTETHQKEIIEKTQNFPAGTVMLIVRGKTKLSEEAFLKIAKEREPQFEATPGLIQKYYIKTNTQGEYGGVYIWDSIESLKKFKESELAATIGDAYQLIEAPSTEVIEIMFELRP
ncbi:hypothetical protein [Carboxylicivirga marina]|uniref:ABM domain-containing protein n=1 Tax=Carboxylicivirga marina TaxID=2800988 RepID=A0ABS1HPF2_9BACT|nr:hypothetical protein [Carboxylicivirga marina]MBK3519565.1 hypothetical protein [Carboxylicivirga marina]